MATVCFYNFFLLKNNLRVHFLQYSPHTGLLKWKLEIAYRCNYWLCAVAVTLEQPDDLSWVYPVPIAWKDTPCKEEGICVQNELPWQLTRWKSKSETEKMWRSSDGLFFTFGKWPHFLGHFVTLVCLLAFDIHHKGSIQLNKEALDASLVK